MKNFARNAILLISASVVGLFIVTASLALFNTKQYHTIPLDMPMPTASTTHTYNDTYSVDTWTYDNFDDEVECLARNIYFESRNQPVNGQLAVALVTMNRVKSARFPNSICDVVWQKRKSQRSGKMVAQFSWTLDGKSDTPTNLKLWRVTREFAAIILDGRSMLNFVDITNGALFYHNDNVNPYWNKYMTIVLVVGAHTFYVN